MGTINLIAPETTTCAIVTGDPVQTVGGSSDSLPVLPEVGGNPVSAGFALLSTKSAFLNACVTTAQRDAMNAKVGMQVYNETTDSYDGFFTAGWASLSGGDSEFDRIRVGDGTEALPSITFTSDLDTGIYRSGANELSFTAGGFNVGRFNGAGLNLFGDGISGSAFLFDEASAHYVALAAPASGSLPSNIVITLPGILPVVDNVPLTCVPGGTTKFNYNGWINKTVAFTHANLLGMYAAPVTVLPTPPSGKGYIIQRVAFVASAGSASSAGGNIFLQYGSSVGSTAFQATVDISSTTLNGGGASNIAIQAGIPVGALTTVGVVDALVSITNKTTPFTGGNQTAVLDIWYSLIDIV